MNIEWFINREKIDPSTSEEYQLEHSKEAQRIHQEESGVLGARYLEKLNHVRDRYTGNKLKKQEEIFFNKLHELWQRLFTSSASHFAMEFLKEVLADQQRKSLLGNFLCSKGITCAADANAAFFYSALTDGAERKLYSDVPSELIESLMRCHLENYQSQQRKFQHEQLPPLLQQIDQKFRNAMRIGLVPFSLEEWIAVRDNTSIMLIDPLNVKRPGREGGHTNFFGIDVSGLVETEEQEHILIHEFLHALVGKTIHKEKEVGRIRNEVLEENVRFHEQRSGLHFIASLDSLIERFRWLNEAITEDLTRAISDVPNATQYQHEIELLELLCSKLGPNGKALFRDAYFEQYHLAKPQGQRLEHYRALVDAMNGTFGSGFLVRLDTYIQEQCDEHGRQLSWMSGVKKAVEQWRKTGDNFPAYIDQWMEEWEKRFKSVARMIITTLKENNKMALQAMRADFGTTFERLWETEIQSLVSSQSPYERTAIKNLVKGYLEKDAFRQE
jgi:hypothetical protein